MRVIAIRLAALSILSCLAIAAVAGPPPVPPVKPGLWETRMSALDASGHETPLPEQAALSKLPPAAKARMAETLKAHVHTTASMTAWDAAMAQSSRNGIQLDAGHYVAGIGGDPVAFIEKHHARIYSMHLKNRKKVCHDGSENMPWGQGDTPLRAILQTLKKNHWAIPAGIEFEYNVPAGSTWEAEIAKCVQYARDALA